MEMSEDFDGKMHDGELEQGPMSYFILLVRLELLCTGPWRLSVRSYCSVYTTLVAHMAADPISGRVYHDYPF